jgi:hypothetical protein
MKMMKKNEQINPKKRPNNSQNPLDVNDDDDDDDDDDVSFIKNIMSQQKTDSLMMNKLGRKVQKRTTTQTTPSEFHRHQKNESFHRSMYRMTHRYNMPIYNNYSYNTLQCKAHTEYSRDETVPLLSKELLTSEFELNFRITDYYNGTKYTTWTYLIRYLKNLGFNVVLDNLSTQIGYSCGIVAQKVNTMLRGVNPNERMTHDTSASVDITVIQEGNYYLARKEQHKMMMMRMMIIQRMQCTSGYAIIHVFPNEHDFLRVVKQTLY